MKQGKETPELQEKKKRNIGQFLLPFTSNVGSCFPPDF